jgi:hypothetical protein
MIPDFSLALLSIGSFSLGLGTLVMRFFVAPSAKEYLVVAAVIFFVAASAIAIGDWNHRAREVTRLSTQIVAVIGNGEKTRDQVAAEVGETDSNLFSAAFDQLRVQGELDSRLATVSLTPQQTIVIRLWYARPTKSSY